MALVTFSPLIADIRGKTADAVFSSWKGRNYVRQRVVPANPQTVAQTAVRDSLAEAVAIWQQLSAALQDGYGNAAANLNISGYNDMVGRNRAALQAETGLFGPRRNTDAAGARIEIPTDFAYDSEPGAGEQEWKWSDTAQGGTYWVGVLVYDVTDNLVIRSAAQSVLMSAEAITVDGFTIGHDNLWAAWVYRDTDDEFVHFGTGAHAQAS